MAHAEPNEPLRVALIGYGLAGLVFHAPLIAATSGMRLASVVTSDPGRQASAIERYPGIRVFPRADPLWERESEHDLVVVATPNRSHVPLGLAALEAGLPVVIDKPMAPSADEGRRLIAAAERHGRGLTVFQNRRWDGDFLTVRRLLSEETLGSVVRFESRFERWRPEVDGSAWRERSHPEEAGGLLFDLGSHLIDQAVNLFGPATSVYAELDRRRPGAVVDDDVFVALTHRSGVRSHLSMTVLAPTQGPRFRVVGTRGTYEKSGLDGQEEALARGERPDGGTAWGREPSERWGRLADGEDVRPIETEPGDYPAFYASVVEALRRASPMPVDPAEAVACLAIIEAALASARTGSVITLGHDVA